MGKFLAWLVVATLLVGLSARAHAAPNDPLKPYVVFALDTSGSMNDPTGSGSPSCGGPDTKLNHARCAITKIVASYGDIVFALGRFRTVMGGSTTATTFPGGCCVAGPDVGANGACAAGLACSTGAEGVSADQLEMLSALVDGNNGAAGVWTNLTGNTCTAVGSDPEIWTASGNTPLEGTLRGAKVYWQGLQAPNFTMWPSTSAGFAPIANDPTKNFFLPSGCDPSPACTTNCCATQCRPYVVILMTDGAETCLGTPQNGASAMLQTTVGGKRYRIQTKPIGFGIAPGDPQIEAIAHGGGAVDIGGVNEGYYASDESGLELAMSSIIAGSIRTEVCNSLDDDCDGLVDEGFPLGGTCDNGKQGVCRRTGTFVCRADGTGVVCNADVGPNGTPEVCNGLDDDCDGLIDEGLTGCTCNPTAELCNNMDDDCDGLIDEGITRPCGIGTCLGTETCVNGNFVGCTATPPQTEVCNGLDDDCDGIIDGFTRQCSTLVHPCVPTVDTSCPASDNPGTTAACIAEGPLCICHPGVKTCPVNGNGNFGGCIGEIGPRPEVCNGLDDDCDGTIDEDTGGGDCSTNCGVGTLVCQNGMLVCNQTVSMSDDTCNGIDDDCDGLIDEDYVSSGPCGQGPPPTVCNGMFQCINGHEVCVGDPIQTESCNCNDDDCDGNVDEGTLCPAGATCTNCQCAFACGTGEFPCPQGKICEQGFCIADVCYGVDCPDVNGHKQVCTKVGNQGVCVDKCSLVTCPQTQVCVPSIGECRPDDCTTFPERCTATQVCINGTCVGNPCDGVTCPSDQYCEAGQCYASCAGVTCPTGERCRLGMCETDPCGHCPYGKACHDDTGECVDNGCGVVTCPQGQWCNPNHNSMCEDDPCVGTKCPDANTEPCLSHPHDPSCQICVGGTCYDADAFRPDAGIEQHVTAGGGGGCSTGGGGGLALALSALLLRRRGGRS